MLQPREKKALALLTVVALVAAAAIVGITALLVRGHEESPPKLSVSTGDGLVRVAPAYWCNLDITECEPEMPTAESLANIVPVDAPVAIGQTMRLSLPTEVAKGPWSLQSTFWTPAGVVTRERIFRSSEHVYTYAIDSTEDRVLLGFELKRITAVLTTPGDENSAVYLAPALYSVRTLPTGFEVPQEPAATPEQAPAEQAPAEQAPTEQAPAEQTPDGQPQDGPLPTGQSSVGVPGGAPTMTQQLAPQG